MILDYFYDDTTIHKLLLHYKLKPDVKAEDDPQINQHQDKVGKLFYQFLYWSEQDARRTITELKTLSSESKRSTFTQEMVR